MNQLSNFKNWFWTVRPEKVEFIDKDALTIIDSDNSLLLGGSVCDEQSVQEREGEDYRVSSRNLSELDAVLGMCRRGGSNYSFEQRDFIWSPIISFGEILLNEFFKLSIHRIPLTLTSSSHQNQFSIHENHQELIVHFSDAGSTCMHIYLPKSQMHRNNPFNKVLVVFPSLSSTQEAYSVLINHVTDNVGWVVVVFNRRGLCNRLTTPTFHITGNDDDTLEMFKALRSIQYFKSKQVVALGYSMGGAQLMRYLGKHNLPSDRLVDGIVASGCVSSPLHSCDVIPTHNEIMSSVLAKVIRNKYVLRDLGGGKTYLDMFQQDPLSHETKARIGDQSRDQFYDIMRQNEDTFRRIADSEDLCEIMFLQFRLQQHFTIPEIREYISMRMPDNVKTLDELVHENNEVLFDYFYHSQPRNYCASIAVPTLTILAEDDPLIVWSHRSLTEYLKSPHTILVSTRSGGHCKFYDGVVDINEVSFAESLMIRFFQSKIQ